MLVSKEIRNNDTLYRKLMNLSDGDTAKFPIITSDDKIKVYAAGFLQGVDVMFYLLQEMGMSNAAIHNLIERTKAYIDAF